MSTTWTKDQEKAINSKNSVIISASAGTGKTAVLTEKVVNLLLSGTKIENLLIMTFSNKAAEEMKNRIKTKLEKKLEELKTAPDSAKNKQLKIAIYSQLKNFSKAHIQTVHSFCYDVIKKHYYLIPNLDSKFSVAENVDVSLMKYQAAANVLNNYYKSPSADFDALYEYIDGTETIEQVIIKAYDSIRNIVDSFEWLEKAVEEYNIKSSEIPSTLKNELLEQFKEYNRIYTLISIELTKFIGDKKLKKYTTKLQDEALIISDVYNKLLANDINAIIPGTFTNYGSAMRLPEEMSVIKDLRNPVKTSIVDNFKKTGFSIPAQIQRASKMYSFGKFFIEILRDFDEEYTMIKTQKKYIDFNDMEHYCYQILSHTDVSSYYKSLFSMVFIDEYQDTSPIQEEIIKYISHDNNIFCVGDLKQSIYRFRSSDPTLFKARMNLYTKGSKGTLISLNNNFRSSANILNCANDVFSHITSTSTEITYTSGDALIHGRSDIVSDAPVYVDILDNSISAEKYPDITSKELEVYNMVKIIKNKIGKPIYDPNIKATRPATYKDICILTRNMTGYVETFNKIFIANSIPFTIDNRESIFEKTEILTLVALLELVVNNNNDLNIITIIHNGLFKFTDEDLISISNLKPNKKVASKDFSYFDRITALANSSSLGTVSLRNKCKQLVGFLTLCKQKERLYSLSNLVSYIVDRSEIKDVFAIENNGAQKIANINLFMSFAANYEGKNYSKLYGFLKYIHNINETNNAFSEAALNLDADQVNITTIHKSKGLEYPIVILGFMGKTFSDKDKRSNIIIDKDAGIGFRYFDNEKREKGSTFIRKNVSKIIEQKTREEEMRLLYVAMTRAQEELYIQGSINATWTDIANSRSMSDWIFSTILTPSYIETGDISVKSTLTGSWVINNVELSELEDIIASQADIPDVEKMLKSLTLRSSKSVSKHIDKIQPIPKITAASLAQKINTFNITSLKKPSFLVEKDYAKIGTIVHSILRYIDLHGDISEIGIKSQIKDMITNNLISQEDIDMVPDKFIKNIFKVLSSPFFEVHCKEDTVIREKSFYNEIPYSEIIDGSTIENSVIVRCIIDIAFICDDGFYVIDYKTDSLDTDSIDSIENIINNHHKQIEIYSKCVGSSLNLPCKGAYLALISTGDIIQVI